jgi:hypothetical protein
LNAKGVTSNNMNEFNEMTDVMMRPDFTFQEVRYIGGSSGSWVNAQIIPTSWGVVVYNPRTTAYAQWFDSPTLGPDFLYQNVVPQMGGIGSNAAPWIDSQIIPTSWGVIVFNPSSGGYAEWVDATGKGFAYGWAQSMPWVNGQIIPTSWGAIAFNPSTTAYAKWYDATGSGFEYQAEIPHMGGPWSGGAEWVNAQIIPMSWGVIVFNPSTRAFAKWYDSPTPGPDFLYQDVKYIPDGWVNAQIIPMSWGVIVFNPSTGAFRKWYNSPTPGPDFLYQDVKYIPDGWVNAQIIPMSWGVIVFNPSTGAFRKGYDSPTPDTILEE